MRGGFLERLTRIDLGTPDRQVGIDRVGSGCEEAAAAPGERLGAPAMLFEQLARQHGVGNAILALFGCSRLVLLNNRFAF
jgi:hypothetical protein